MTTEQQIKSIILEKFKSIRSFSLSTNIPYSTIDNMLKRGVSGTGIQTVLKVCHALDIDIESIESGQIRYSPSPTKVNLSADLTVTPQEQEIIKKYRALDQRGQDAVIETLEREYSYTAAGAAKQISGTA